MYSHSTRSARLLMLVTAAAAALVLAGCGGESSPTGDGAPAAPTNVTSESGSGYVLVRWEHDGEDATGFEVRRTESGSLAKAQAETFEVGAGARRYVDSSIEPGVTYRYTVAARGQAGTSQPAAPPPGADEAGFEASVDMLVGTNDRRWDDGVGTIFVVYYGIPGELADDPAVTYEARIDGPPGWNDGDPVEWSLDADASERDQGWSFINENPVDAVDGEYTLTVTLAGTPGPSTYSRTVTFDDAGFYLGGPTDIAPYDVGPTSVSAEWTPPEGTMSTVVTLYRLGEEDELLVREGTYDTRHTFDGLDLEDGSYAVEVAPFNFDVLGFPGPADPIGLSYRRGTFMLGNDVSPLCDAPSDVVEIPDEALEAAVRDEVDAPEGDLTCLDMSRIEDLEAEGAGIASLTGLDYAVNVQSLDLGGNAIGDLAPLSGLDQLWYLELDGPDQAFADLSALEGMTGLGELSVNEVPLGDDEIWPYVESLTGLISLDVQDTSVSETEMLRSLTQLEELVLSDTNVTSVAFVEDLPNLRSLWLSYSDVADLGPVFALTGLEELEISGFGVDDVGFAEDLPNLEVLGLADCAVTDFAPLETVATLRDLEVSACGITDASFLADLAQLEALEIRENPISNFGPIATMTQLVELDIGETGLSDIEFLEDFSELEELDLADNEITDIGPLVANAGLGEGDEVSIEENLLDLEDPDAAADIQALLDRGVELEYESQRTAP